MSSLTVTIQEEMLTLYPSLRVLKDFTKDSETHFFCHKLEELLERMQKIARRIIDKSNDDFLRTVVLRCRKANFLKKTKERYPEVEDLTTLDFRAMIGSAARRQLSKREKQSM